MSRLRVCFVTGTRAEFGLMRSALQAIGRHPKLALQIIATGMHLDRSRGGTARDLGRIDATVPWKPAGNPAALAAATGAAMGRLAKTLEQLQSDVVLVVGDRVEAFAAAAAGAIGGRVVAHVHGGDRALGQVDDSLRHAITKLAHVHFPATQQSARRIARLGEQRWRIHTVGSPGIDGIVQAAAPRGAIARFCPGLVWRRYALAVLHPVDADERIERERAGAMLSALLAAGVEQVVAIYPNTDPGAAGIVGAWREAESHGRCLALKNVPREIFLGLLRDAAMLVGNSSAGIIEASSFGTPVVDIGPRQLGRQRAEGVRSVAYWRRAIAAAIAAIWNKGRPRRVSRRNPYARNGQAGRQIADILGRLKIDRRLTRKLITR